MDLLPTSREDNIKLNEILGLMARHKLSFIKFFLLCFNSDNEDVMRRVGYFYKAGGPGICLDIWVKKIVWREDIGLVLPNAAAFVVKHVKNELEQASHQANLKKSLSKMTAKHLATFRIEVIEEELERHAPTALTLIHGLIQMKKRAATLLEPPPPPCAIAVMSSMVLHSWNVQMNLLQGVLGIYFYTQAASSSLVLVLEKAGISVSHKSIHRGLESMTTATILKVRSIAAEKKTFFIVYDNINMAFWHQDQCIDNKNTFENGATATLIVTSKQPGIERTRDPTRYLTAAALHPTREQNDHLASMF